MARQVTIGTASHLLTMHYSLSDINLVKKTLIQVWKKVKWSCYNINNFVVFKDYAPAPRVGALSDDTRLTSVCLSHTSGLSREQRGLGRLKFAQR